MADARIKAIDQTSVHRITSSQVVVDLQTAIKELVENALDAGANVIEVRIKDNGVKAIEVIDNGSGIAKDDYDTVALKHHTSKLSTFNDLTTVETFGFRGEALTSLCALCENVTITTATSAEAPMGTILELDRVGRVTNKERRVARQRGTTVSLTGLFVPLPVRRKEFERHAKREYGKALNLLTAYALVPCTTEGGVKLTVSNVSDSGKKSVQIQTDGSTLLKNSVTALWGSKAMDNIIPLDLDIEVEPDSASVKRRGLAERTIMVKMTGLVSKFAIGGGRSSNDRQFFFVNKRPCNLPKIQKAFNEIYKSFNATQSPFIVVDFTLPTDACDINVSPDKRTIFLHSEHNLIEAMKAALTGRFEDSRGTYAIHSTGTQAAAEKLPARLNRRTTAPEPIQAPSSPEPVAFAPSSDPLPVTQPVTLVVPPPESVEEVTSIPIDTVENERSNRQTKTSSKLLDHISPSPPVQQGDPDDGTITPAIIPRKRAASRSPEPSPIRIVVTASRPKKPVKMVLNTTGASWALAKTSDAASTSTTTSGARNPSGNAANPKKGLNQFRRGGDPDMESRPVKNTIVVSDSDEEIAEDVTVVTKSAPSTKSRASSRSSRTSMQVDSPPASPESESDVPKQPPNGNVQLASSRKETVTTHPIPPNETRAKKPRVIAQEDDGPVEVTPVPTPEMNSGEIMKDDEIATLPMAFNLESITAQWNEASSRMTAAQDAAITKRQERDALSKTIVIDRNQDNPEELLSRVVQKQDFERMEILGQFNLGFIIVRTRKSHIGSSEDAMDVDGKDETDDLFIVDQHAADEKYNFETLQLTTRIESQKLIRARPLDLSASDKLVALENMEVLQSNGFEVEEGGEDGAGQLLLVSQPVSKSTVFDMNDLSELLHLMQDKPAGTMVRCSKARAMFASRACRKSVMIGHPLSRTQMTSVVRHMSTMDQPWNCPHGRPTMRHLMRMPARQAMDVMGGSRKVDWERLQ